jgi:hypothetical protein
MKDLRKSSCLWTLCLLLMQFAGYSQVLYTVGLGKDRSPTVGFRCVKDIDSKNFNDKHLKSIIKVSPPSKGGEIKILIILFYRLRFQSPVDKNQA